MTLQERLEQIEKRLKLATPGSWGILESIDKDQAILIGATQKICDAELIASAPTDLALLLKIVRLQADVIECTKQVLPFLKTSNDFPDPMLAVTGSPAESMRRAATEMEKRDSLIIGLRQAIAKLIAEERK